MARSYGSNNSGRGGQQLTPSDIQRPGLDRDPGVTMRPVATLLGNPEDPRGPALNRAAVEQGSAISQGARAEGNAIDAMAASMRGFSRDMSAVGVAFQAMHLERQKAEDAVAIDKGQLLLNQAFETSIQKKLNSPDTAKRGCGHDCKQVRSCDVDERRSELPDHADAGRR